MDYTAETAKEIKYVTNLLDKYELPYEIEVQDYVQTLIPGRKYVHIGIPEIPYPDDWKADFSIYFHVPLEEMGPGFKMYHVTVKECSSLSYRKAFLEEAIKDIKERIDKMRVTTDTMEFEEKEENVAPDANEQKLLLLIERCVNEAHHSQWLIDDRREYKNFLRFITKALNEAYDLGRSGY